MKLFYLVLTALGFAAPNYFVIKESIATGNLLFWVDWTATLNGMFANTISTAFVVDLLFVVGVFFIWTYQDSMKHGLTRKTTYWVWALTLLFGMAGSFPLYLYLRARASENV